VRWIEVSRVKGEQREQFKDKTSPIIKQQIFYQFPHINIYITTKGIITLLHRDLVLRPSCVPAKGGVN
jgi:hypothetical protein